MERDDSDAVSIELEWSVQSWLRREWSRCLPATSSLIRSWHGVVDQSRLAALVATAAWRSRHRRLC